MDHTDTDSDGTMSVKCGYSYESESECVTYSSSDVRHRDSVVFENYSQRFRNRQAHCSSRNAIMARENRLRKKEYLKNVENEVIKLRRENRMLHKKMQVQSNNLESLKNEITYLKNVISNNTSIKRLLTGLNSVLQAKKPVASVEVNQTVLNSSGFLTQPNCDPVLSSITEPDDILLLDPVELNSGPSHIDYSDSLLPQVGICLHVNNKNISLEFCPQCNLSGNEELSCL